MGNDFHRHYHGYVISAGYRILRSPPDIKIYFQVVSRFGDADYGPFFYKSGKNRPIVYDGREPEHGRGKGKWKRNGYGTEIIYGPEIGQQEGFFFFRITMIVY